ncbi:MAG: helix-turn-helix transcriptional regulator [Arenicella sp.]
MRKSDRLFQLTNILRSHQPITAKQLSEKLSVSQRTIYRYIDDLSVAGIPVYGEVGVGYRLSEGFELPPIQLTRLEMEALVIGVNLVTVSTGDKLSKASRSLLNKIEAALPNRAMVNSKSSEYAVRVPDDYQIESTRQTWEVLHQAIEKKHSVRVVYTSLSGSTSERNILPLGLFYWGGKWTLGGWCYLRKDYRSFRVDRIDTAEKSAIALLADASVSLENYIQAQKPIEN